ncbi:unnamed protein product [Lampetra fluviatilis]
MPPSQAGGRSASGSRVTKFHDREELQRGGTEPNNGRHILTCSSLGRGSSDDAELKRRWRRRWESSKLTFEPRCTESLGAVSHRAPSSDASWPEPASSLLDKPRRPHRSMYTTRIAAAYSLALRYKPHELTSVPSLISAFPSQATCTASCRETIISAALRAQMLRMTKHNSREFGVWASRFSCRRSPSSGKMLESNAGVWADESRWLTVGWSGPARLG